MDLDHHGPYFFLLTDSLCPETVHVTYHYNYLFLLFFSLLANRGADHRNGTRHAQNTDGGGGARGSTQSSLTNFNSALEASPAPTATGANGALTPGVGAGAGAGAGAAGATGAGAGGGGGEMAEGEFDAEFDAEVDDGALYCFCRQSSFGAMVACDDDNCKYEWVCGVFWIQILFESFAYNFLFSPLPPSFPFPLSLSLSLSLPHNLYSLTTHSSILRVSVYASLRGGTNRGTVRTVRRSGRRIVSGMRRRGLVVGLGEVLVLMGVEVPEEEEEGEERTDGRMGGVREGGSGCGRVVTNNHQKKSEKKKTSLNLPLISPAPFPIILRCTYTYTLASSWKEGGVSYRLIAGCKEQPSYMHTCM